MSRRRGRAIGVTMFATVLAVYVMTSGAALAKKAMPTCHGTTAHDVGTPDDDAIAGTAGRRDRGKGRDRCGRRRILHGC